jgi:hypothetical protein
MRERVSYVLPGTRQELVIGAITLTELDFLKSEVDAGKSPGQATINVIARCLGIEPKEYKKFLFGDHLASILALRRASYGDEYVYELPCSDPECKVTSEFTTVLSSLPLEYLDPKQPVEGLEFVLDDGKCIVWKIPSVGDFLIKEQDLVLNKKEGKKEAKKAARAEGLTAGALKPVQNLRPITYQMSILVTDIKDKAGPEGKSILKTPADGYERREEIRQFVSAQSAGFCLEFFQDIDQFMPGPRIDVVHECPECGETLKAVLPIEEGFFLQSRRSSRKETTPQATAKSRVPTPWKTTTVSG